MSRNTRYFVVRNVANLGTGTQVASGTLTGSPTLTFSGEITNGDYILVRTPEDGTAPTGASVTELSADEARMSTQSGLFTGGMPTPEFAMAEKTQADVLRAAFVAAQDALPAATADALLTALEPTNLALSAGSITIGYLRFNASAVDQATKDTFNPLFEDFFKKFPRSLG
jgi:hypothetical protein